MFPDTSLSDSARLGPAERLPNDASAAEDLLVDFLARRDRPTLAELDELCRSHPACAAELRRLFDEWSRLERLLRERAGPPRPARVAAETLPAPNPIAPWLAQLAGQANAAQRYTDREELARGGMGIVYRVWDRDLRRGVAMKVLHGERLGLGRPGSARRARLLARFLEEAQITAQLDHPGIVPVHEIGVDQDENVYFTMPLVRGVELGAVLDLTREGLGGWSLTKALGVFVRVCEAVGYAHSKGVVHRDLKPSNVMVGRFGETYVMDWGLARVVASAGDAAEPADRVATSLGERRAAEPGSPFCTRDGAVAGTPAYMAPEQVSGHASEVGTWSDVYAIGAMLYHLLAGQPPYVRSDGKVTPDDVLTARLLGPPEPVLSLAPGASRELAAICERAMHLDRRARYAGALDLAADLERFLDRRPVAAYPASPGYALRLAIARNKSLSAVIAACAVLAIGLACREVIDARSDAREEARLRGIADVERARHERLSDFAGARVLLAEHDELFPATPERAPAMRAWLARADELLGRAPEYREASLVPNSEAGEHVARLAQLARVRETIARRAEVAESLVARTIDSRRDEWTRASDSIASLPIYRGLRLAPQRGLVPLRLDPRSGLWEFWVDGTGEEPLVRAADSAELELHPESALVLVLLPGGRATLGGAAADEPRREVEFEPFFLGKTEVPQSVWTRVLGANPSKYRDDESARYAPWTPMLPVEYVDWRACSEFARRTDLALPTEAQWEFAASAGGSESFAFGPSDDARALEGRENLSREALDALLGVGRTWRDGATLTAPVMSFAPNAFGLHDVLGNVSEWCADVYAEIPNEALALVTDSSAIVERSFRGGSYYTPLASALRPSFRQHDLPHGANQTRGLRVARAVRS